ncbi:MAG TPA: beta-propeller fold lactonase family protein [Candidatus Binataceae bacterium]|nr:beta-propeller fold lactonase family protein [Candidatus Binataceae bacterium]
MLIAVGLLLVAGATLAALFEACGGSSATTQPPVATEFAYVVNSAMGGGKPSLSTYSVGASGSLSAISTLTTGVPASPFSLAVTPGSQFLLLAGRGLPGSIAQYSISFSGGLTQFGSPVATGNLPYTIAVTPSGSFAIESNNGDNTVSVYRLGAGGQLSLIGSTATGSVPSAVAVDPTGRYVFVANLEDNNISEYLLNPTTGALTVNGVVQSDLGPASIVVSPNGPYAYAANRLTGDVSEYKLDPGSGSLTLVANLESGSGSASGAGWLAIDPGGRWLYVANSQDQSVTLFDINPNNGALTLVGTVNTQQSGGFLASVAIDRGGHFLYAINAAGLIFEFQINPATGVLSPIGTTAAGAAPWSMAFAS